jgi:hypothetical protein
MKTAIIQEPTRYWLRSREQLSKRVLRLPAAVVEYGLEAVETES